jgi:type II secretory pathway pseudopilin PulG
VKKHQDGFTAVEAILMVVIVGIIGGVGFFVWHAQAQANKNLGDAEKSSSSIYVSEKPGNIKIKDCNLEKQALPKFAFNKGCFVISFPTAWTIQQYAPNDPSGRMIGVSEFTQDDTGFVFSSLGDVSNVPSKVNNFGGTLFIYDKSNSSSGKLPHPEDGTVKQLKNGLRVWTTKPIETDVAGKKIPTKCPNIYIANGAITEQQLKNGRYIAFNGSFCWAQNMGTNQTYDQQINSKEFKDAYAMLESITFFKK